MPAIEFNENDREEIVENAVPETEVEGTEEVLNGEEQSEVQKEEPERELEKEEKLEEPAEESEEESEEEGKEEEPKTEEETLKEIEVEYQDSEGNEYKEKVSQEDLPNIMSVAREGVKAIDYIEQIKPIMNTFEKSKVIQDIAYYVSQGHTDDEIKKGLIQLWSQDVEGKEPEFETIEEQVNYLIQKNLQKVVDPLKSKLEENEKVIKQRQEKEQYTEIESANKNVFEEALTKQGHEPQELTQTELDAIDDTFSALYPGVDIRQIKISPKQANIIIRNALSPKGIKKAERNKVKNISKQSKATRSIPGNATRAQSTTSKYIPRATPRSEAERQQRVDELFGI